MNEANQEAQEKPQEEPKHVNRYLLMLQESDFIQLKQMFPKIDGVLVMGQIQADNPRLMDLVTINTEYKEEASKDGTPVQESNTEESVQSSSE